MEPLWSYIKKVSTGMVDEKVTVTLSFSTLLFLLLKLGMPKLHLVKSMRVTVIFSNKTGVRLIIYTALLTTTWYARFTDEHVVTVLVENTIYSDCLHLV